MRRTPLFGDSRWVAALVLGALFAPSALGQDAPLSVDEAVRLGLTRNLTVTAGNAGVAAAYANYRSLAALPPITVTGTRVQGTSTAPTLNGETTDTIVDVGEIFDLSGQRRWQAAGLNATFNAAKYTLQESLISLEQQIRDGYWSLAAARGQTKIAVISLTEARRVYDLTVKQEQAGASPHGDVVRSSIDVANAKQTLEAAKGAERSALIALNALLARDPSAPITLAVDMADNPDLPTPTLVPLKKMIAQAVTDRPLLKSAVEQTRSAIDAVRQAEASRFPDLSVDYQRSLQSTYQSLLFSVNFPLFDFGSVSQSIKAAKETRKQNEALQTQTEQQVKQQVAQARSDLEVATQSAADYKKEILDPSVTLLDMAQLGYKQGATGILAVIDAESTIRNARVGYINSLLAIYKAEDEARAALGTIPPVVAK
jgi:cobalt-zinc-cadmium efflux system outer membrane protein